MSTMKTLALGLVVLAAVLTVAAATTNLRQQTAVGPDDDPIMSKKQYEAEVALLTAQAFGGTGPISMNSLKAVDVYYEAARASGQPGAIKEATEWKHKMDEVVQLTVARLGAKSSAPSIPWKGLTPPHEDLLNLPEVKLTFDEAKWKEQGAGADWRNFVSATYFRPTTTSPTTTRL